MKFEIYDNIGISLVAFLSVLKDYKQIDYAKVLLILPLLLYNPLTNHIKDGRVNVRSIEDLILSKIEYFLNFNERFTSLLPLSINTIFFAEKFGFIKIENDFIYIIKNQIEMFDFESKQLGNRSENIIKASRKISRILKEDSKSLYFKLRIEL